MHEVVQQAKGVMSQACDIPVMPHMLHNADLCVLLLTESVNELVACL